MDSIKVELKKTMVMGHGSYRRQKYQKSMKRHAFLTHSRGSLTTLMKRHVLCINFSTIIKIFFQNIKIEPMTSTP